jgi:transcriptional regulator with XRE-family HTH domain
LRQAVIFTISATMKPTQCRMARAGLGWSVDDLEKHSGISRRTVLRFEAGEKVKLETVEALRGALVQGGALFVEVEGRPGVAVNG